MELNNKVMGGILVVAVVAVISFLAFGVNGATVSAIGNAEIKAQPDIVSVYLNLEGKGDNATSAKDMLDEINDELLINLIKIGLNRDEIKTESINVYQNYEWQNGKRIDKGYIAVQRIVIETDDFDLTSEIIDVAIDSGALVNWINFELTEERRSDLKIEALEKAGIDARKKAEATANGLGKKLGRLISVQSEEFNYGPYRAYDSGVALEKSFDGEEAVTSASEDVLEAAGIAAREAALNLEPSDIKVSSSIRVQYKLSNF